MAVDLSTADRVFAVSAHGGPVDPLLGDGSPVERVAAAALGRVADLPLRAEVDEDGLRRSAEAGWPVVVVRAHGTLLGVAPMTPCGGSDPPWRPPAGGWHVWQYPWQGLDGRFKARRDVVVRDVVVVTGDGETLALYGIAATRLRTGQQVLFRLLDKHDGGCELLILDGRDGRARHGKPGPLAGAGLRQRQ